MTYNSLKLNPNPIYLSTTENDETEQTKRAEIQYPPLKDWKAR